MPAVSVAATPYRRPLRATAKHQDRPTHCLGVARMLGSLLRRWRRGAPRIRFVLSEHFAENRLGKRRRKGWWLPVGAVLAIAAGQSGTADCRGPRVGRPPTPPLPMVALRRHKVGIFWTRARNC